MREGREREGGRMSRARERDSRGAKDRGKELWE